MFVIKKKKKVHFFILSLFPSSRGFLNGADLPWGGAATGIPGSAAALSPPALCSRQLCVPRGRAPPAGGQLGDAESPALLAPAGGPSASRPPAPPGPALPLLPAAAGTPRPLRGSMRDFGKK